MDCPKCGHPMWRPRTEGHFVCYACGWERDPDNVEDRPKLFGVDALKGREPILHLIVSVGLIMLPFFVMLVIYPLLARYSTIYRANYFPETRHWFLTHYWIFVAIYLAISALLNPQPDPDTVDDLTPAKISYWAVIQYLVGGVLIPGKWFWLSVYSYWRMWRNR